MSLGAAVLLGLALSAPPGPAIRPAAERAPCAKYRAHAERSDLVPDGEVAAWATAALERAALLDARSPCAVHVRVTAGPIRKGGVEDGWIAHVSLSTRRFLKDGKLVTREKGKLLVEPRKEDLAAKARGLVEEYVASLKQPAPKEDSAVPSDG